MGIPHLTSVLEPYRTLDLLNNEKVIIDGPALAYHLLHCFQNNGRVHPPHGALGKIAVLWLDALANCEVTIHAIYFDGYLPPEKLATRMERQARTTSQLNRFLSSSPGGCPLRLFFRDPTLSAVPDAVAPPQRRGDQMPPPPFLVPAVIEALSQSKYRHLVRTVPSEADGACAKRAMREGGLVLTSDSDLFVYDLGDARVALLKDVGYPSGDACRIWVYDPKVICSRLFIASPQRLAYQVYIKPQATLPQLIRDCIVPVVDEEAYQLFCARYDHEEVIVVPEPRCNRPLDLNVFDPRIAELIMQFGVMSDEPPTIFLPVLIEDTTKGNVWENSTFIRTMAYTLCCEAFLRPVTHISEYRRIQSTAQKGRTVHIWSLSDLNEVVTHLLMLSQNLRPSFQVGEFWLMLCLVLDIKMCQKDGRRSATLEIIEQFVSNTPPRAVRDEKVSWNVMQLVAKVQAGLYSFRMLKQIMSLGSHSPETDEVVLPLQEMLDDLPPLKYYPTVHDITELLLKAKTSAAGVVFTKYVGVPTSIPGAVPAEEAPKKKKSKKKKTKTTPEGREDGDAGKRSDGRNRFDLLSKQ